MNDYIYCESEVHAGVGRQFLHFCTRFLFFFPPGIRSFFLGGLLGPQGIPHSFSAKKQLNKHTLNGSAGAHRTRDLCKISGYIHQTRREHLVGFLCENAENMCNLSSCLVITRYLVSVQAGFRIDFWRIFLLDILTFRSQFFEYLRETFCGCALGYLEHEF